jgi:hypothetical protein
MDTIRRSSLAFRARRLRNAGGLAARVMCGNCGLEGHDTLVTHEKRKRATGGRPLFRSGMISASAVAQPLHTAHESMVGMTGFEPATP